MVKMHLVNAMVRSSMAANPPSLFMSANPCGRAAMPRKEVVPSSKPAGPSRRLHTKLFAQPTLRFSDPFSPILQWPERRAVCASCYSMKTRPLTLQITSAI